jgi:hypothetical protein
MLRNNFSDLTLIYLLTYIQTFKILGEKKSVGLKWASLLSTSITRVIFRFDKYLASVGRDAIRFLLLLSAFNHVLNISETGFQVM